VPGTHHTDQRRTEDRAHAEVRVEDVQHRGGTVAEADREQLDVELTGYAGR
jgi:hypothetical protein